MPKKKNITGPMGQPATGVETSNFMVNPIVFELRCACGKVCGTKAWPAGTKIDLEKVAKEYQTVCDGCKKLT